MQIRVLGSNMEVGKSLTQHVEEHLAKSVNKYFEKAIHAEVHFTKAKDGALFSVVIVVHEGIKNGGITVKSDASAGDVYGCFNEALDKAAKQLRRYKRRIVNYRRQRGSIKNAEPSYDEITVPTKYILPPSEFNVFEEMEAEEISDDSCNNLNILTEKSTEIEELTVNEAIMKMDLSDLPALVFINKLNKRINVVYHRKDGNISWIDPKI